MENVILVTTDSDSARLTPPFTRRLCFSHYLTPAGALRRRIATLEPSSSLLGVSDLYPLESPPISRQLCSDLIAETHALGCPGVFLDFDRNTPALQEFLQLADSRLAAENIPLYVPERCAEPLSHAIAVCDAAVSGGSFDYLFGSLQELHGPQRVAAMLQPICTGFELPSQDADGDRLSLSALEELRARHGAQVYFSKELCAKYFTYMDEHGQGHFVLFDDKSTIQEKHRRLSALGIPCFVLARDAELLL